MAELRGVTFGYRGAEPILDDLSLMIASGEFLAILGPSGCGKTTILNLFAGFISPLEGRVEFRGQALRGINTGVGYMTQTDTLLPWKTVAANVALPLEVRGVPKASRADDVDATLEMVGLSDARDKYPGQLSGGMKRRALLARSLIYQPVMLLMDEPFGALDAQMREALHDEFLRTVQALDQTVLFVTHDITESVLLADRILVVGGSPLTVLSEIHVPFGDERDVEELPVTTEFTELQRKIRVALQKPAEPDIGERNVR